MFRVISSERDMMEPLFFEQGLRLNSDGYIHLLETIVKPWIDRVAHSRPFVFQQDSAPCRTSGMSKKWLSNNCYDFISPNVWPPNSPACNPCDYYLWGAVEKETNRTARDAELELCRRIKAVFAYLPRGTVKTACSMLRVCVEAVTKEQGGYFE